MKRLTLYLTLTIAAAWNASPARGITYYVDSSFSGVSNGSQDYPFTTISEAIHWIEINAPTPGTNPDVVHVKAGYYQEAVHVERANIHIKGYKTTPGDLDAGEGVPSSYDDMTNHSNDQPVIWSTDRATGTGIFVDGVEDVVIKNLTVYNWLIGVRVYNVLGTSVTELENIVAIDFGSLDDDEEEFDYSGRGIFLDWCVWTEMDNCVVLNAAAEGIRVSGGGLNTVTNCQVYCDDDSVNGTHSGGQENGISSTDYYYLMVDTDNNIIENCYLEKIKDTGTNTWPARGAHGYLVHARSDLGQQAVGNKILDCTAVAVSGSVEFRGYGVRDTVVEDFSGYRGAAPYNESKNTIVLAYGPHDNVFRRVLLSKTWQTVCTYGSIDNPASNQVGDDDAVFWGVSSSGNVFENCAFVDSVRGIDFNPYDEFDGTGQLFSDNLFNHCTWIADPNETTVMIRNKRNGQNNQLNNCIVYGYDSFYESDPSSSFEPDISYDSCCFFGSFAPPSGTNILLADPQFLSGGPAISAGSPCIGQATATPSVSDDFWQSARTPVHDMGAFEAGSPNPLLQP